MDLLEQLEQRARELGHRVKKSLGGDNGYDFQAANDRDLLEAAAHYIRAHAEEGASRRVI